MIELTPNFDINSHIYIHIQPEDGNDFCVFLPASYVKIPASIPDTELRKIIIDLWLRENLTIGCDIDIALKCTCVVCNKLPAFNEHRRVLYIHHKTDGIYSIILPAAIRHDTDEALDQWVHDALIHDKIDKTIKTTTGEI